MEPVNILHVMWSFYSFVVLFMGANVIYRDDRLPEFLSRIYRFGKSSRNSSTKCLVARFEVPKRWFTHFYLFASTYFLLLNLEVWRRYFLGSSTGLFDWLLDFFTAVKRPSAIVTPESVLVLTFLLLLQACRRCYECLYVSIYSQSKMNLTHYIVGITFYFGVGLSVLAEAPGFESNRGGSIDVAFSEKWISPARFLGILTFLVGFTVQYYAHAALASLRKDEKGKKVVTLKHGMPVGGLFEYVSCPHYTAEIIMYLAGSIILDGLNFTWWLVCLWVISNQIMTGLMSHQWYQENFKDYPKMRKAVIPWVL